MQVDTKEFGQIQVEEQNIFTFAGGLYGLEDYQQFALIRPDASLPFAYLQATEEPLVSLLLADPFAFQPRYEFDLPSTEVAALQGPTPEDLVIWVTVNMKDGALQNASMNLLAPIVLNKKSNTGRQVVLHDSGYSTRVPLFTQPKEGK